MSGAERIAKERRRQIEKEGWTPGHDNKHNGSELALAAVCYAAPERVYVQRVAHGGVAFVDPWPWSSSWDKRSTRKRPTRAERVRMLEKAGALIAAEIDRLLRGVR